METVKYCSPGVFRYTAFFTVHVHVHMNQELSLLFSLIGVSNNFKWDKFYNIAGPTGMLKMRVPLPAPSHGEVIYNYIYTINDDNKSELAKPAVIV